VGGLLCRPSSDRVARWALGWGVLWVGLTAAAAATVRADIYAVGPLQGAAPVGLWTFLTEVPAGQALAFQMLAAASAVILVVVGTTMATRWAAVVLALVGAMAPALAGHTGLSGLHVEAAISLCLHIAGVSVWVGGLAVVSALLLLEPERLADLLPRFSVLALVCVVVVAETGLLNASLRAGTAEALAGSTYGSLVLAKAVLLAWLIRLGWLQRRRAVDRLRTPGATVTSSVAGTVARLAGVELLAMGTALAVSVVMARIGPAPVPIPGVAPLTLVVAALAAPMVLVMAVPRGWRVSDAAPEAASVVMLVVIVEVGGVGLLRVLLGSTIGLLAEGVLLVVAGWLCVSAARDPRGRGGLIVAMAGLPFAMAAAVLLADAPGDERMAIVAVLAGEALLVGWHLRASRSVSATVPAAPEPVQVAG
jgi:putative copper resistance protein D